MSSLAIPCDWFDYITIGINYNERKSQKKESERKHSSRALPSFRRTQRGLTVLVGKYTPWLLSFLWVLLEASRRFFFNTMVYTGGAFPPSPVARPALRNKNAECASYKYNIY